MPVTMPRIYLRFVLLCFALFAVALLVSHIQPYDNHELRQWLLPEGCPAPCFMGIRPGVTTADEAIQILKASPWVEQAGYRFGSALIQIKWNAHAPWWIADNANDGSFILTAQGLVTDVRVTGNLKLGDIQLMLGQTPLQFIGVDYFDAYAVILYSMVYLDNGVIASVTKACDHRAAHISHQDKVFLDYVAINRESDLPRQYPNSWGDVLRTSCT